MATNAPIYRQAYLGFGSLVTRYFPFDYSWTPYEFVAVLPENAENPLLRFGECVVNGTLLFDDIEVHPALPVQMQVGNLELGSGESFRSGHYKFQSQFADFSGNYSRPLLRHTSRFEGSRWRMAGDTFVEYRHGFNGLVFTNALITATMNSKIGELVAEVSTDGTSWQEAGRASSDPSGASTVLTTNVPADLLPAATIYVRFSATTNLDFTKYVFEGDLPGGSQYADGNTLFFEQRVPGTMIVPLSVSDSPTGFVLNVQIRNPDPDTLQLALNCQSQGPAGTRESTQSATIPAQSTNIIHLALPTAGAGPNTVQVEILDSAQGTMLSQGSLNLWVAAIRDSSFGLLLGGSPNCPAWWCEATYKVSRDRALPTDSGPIRISAARNEYEPFQVVLRPLTTLTNIQVSIGDFLPVGQLNAPPISATNVQVNLVEYVPVTEPTDMSGAVGDHPDPLPLLNGGFDASAQINQPLWFTVYVPKDAPAGDYEATISLASPELNLEIPARLHVFNFALSETTHTRTAYNVRIDPYWYPVTNSAQQNLVWDLYMDDYRRHRISPYIAHTYAPIIWSYNGQKFTYDFSAFDTTMTRYLDEFQFNGFNLMTLPGWLGGYPPFDPGWRRLFDQLMQPIMAHLREKGWLEKAYCYWYDEPQPPMFPFVVNGMQAVQEAAPGLHRLLTVYPEPSFYNQVEIWVPFLNSFEYFYDLRAKQRQIEGDDFWWYVCTDPDAPFPNNFVDHAAINQRIRPWLAEKYDVRGELYWNSSWYLGLNGQPRNPWTNAMTTASPGWPQGNGDGLLLYPAARTPPTGPVLDPPVDSLRWELLREGLEDAEYFWLLKNRLEYAQATLGAGSAAVAQGYAAREAALGLVPSGRTFERDPEKLYTARQRIAEAIEALDDGTPFIVRQPVPRSASVGGSATFRTEALGWPLPEYQWQFNGTNLDGATSSVLVLSNADLSMAGEYAVLASNNKGMAASAPARLAVLLPEGKGSQLPQILVQPASVVQRPGTTAVLAVTAVSPTPLTYTWFFNGIPIDGVTNAALAITNLAAGQLGTYAVTIGNAAGTVTSAPATVAFPGPPNVQASWGAEGGLRLEYLGYSRPSHIEVSTNLLDWTVLYDLLPQPDPVNVLDNTARADSPRFYRVRIDW